MPEANPAQDALDRVNTLLNSAQSADTLGRALPDRSWTPANQRRFLELVAEGNTARSPPPIASPAPARPPPPRSRSPISTPGRRGAWTAEQWSRAEAAGLVALAPPPPEQPAPMRQPCQPVSEPEPVWEDDEHGWLTDAPPPEDFDGEEEGEYGDEDYARTLTEEEEEIWLAPIVRERAEQRAEEAANWQAFLATRRRAEAHWLDADAGQTPLPSSAVTH